MTRPRTCFPRIVLFGVTLVGVFLAARSGAATPTAEAEAVEQDWRLQDGIGTPREAVGYREAIEQTLARGDALLADLAAAGARVTEQAAEWRGLREQCERLAAGGAQADAPQWEDLWRRVHVLRRRIALGNPLLPEKPIVFVKQAVGGMFSHQLTQYYGSCARPGGGVFVLDAPGRSTAARSLTEGKLPEGSYQHLDVSYDGRRVRFSYCRTDTTPRHREERLDRFFHLYEIGADGSGLRQLTDGPYDDFSPRYLPDGRTVFVSTRRGGFHRCGRGPCAVYTLALIEADGSHPRTISFHETHEWDPAVLHDGSLVYTRWDYVDRNAVHYQHLWSTRPDGSGVRIFYGNNTWNPVGIWEARAVPGSRRVMATAAAHHAMTAGSIILVDGGRDVDGEEPIARLTPDAMFPESETPVGRLGAGTWVAPVVDRGKLAVPVEERRWPGHCYRSPFPLSETHFLAAYSFQRLIGEPDANPAEMFGLYLVDAFGNKELLHRDPELSSVWPAVLQPRLRPPVIPSVAESPPPLSRLHATTSNPSRADATTSNPSRAVSARNTGATRPGSEREHERPGSEREHDFTSLRLDEAGTAAPAEAGTPAAETPASPPRGKGTFFMQNVHAAWPALPEGSIKRLRIVQVLPKSTPHLNEPPVGVANGSPGKQVLGTVPVEADGSAHFVAPAGIPLSFQALDERGRAVQTMRSLTYLQPGETLGCVGCHEPRTTAPPPVGRFPRAAARPASPIEPGPEGSNPLSYPILVQPVLDTHCVRCHNPEKPEGKVVLTGEPEGRYTVSYNALAPRVAYSAWKGNSGAHMPANGEPLTTPGRFGALGTRLMDALLEGHEGVVLGDEDIERLATWMDANALFYGTFDPADQARQQRGETIAGPALE